jgi:hypothetical protein
MTFEYRDEFHEMPRLLLIWSGFCGRKEYALVLYQVGRQVGHAVIGQSATAKAWAQQPSEDCCHPQVLQQPSA